jgi:hypothetical protein
MVTVDAGMQKEFKIAHPSHRKKGRPPQEWADDRDPEDSPSPRPSLAGKGGIVRRWFEMTNDSSGSGFNARISFGEKLSGLSVSTRFLLPGQGDIEIFLLQHYYLIHAKTAA